jgi:hypothetical protein
MLPDLLPSQSLHEQERRVAFPGMSLQDFMERTSLYEQTPVLFPSNLRRATWIGLALTAISSLILVLLPIFADYLYGVQFPFFLSGLHVYRDIYVHWLLSSVWICYLNGLLLGSGAMLLILTHNLQRGRVEQQWIAFVQALGGCTNFLLMAAILLFILPDLLLWILAFCLVLLGVALVLRIVFALLR